MHTFGLSFILYFWAMFLLLLRCELCSILPVAWIISTSLDLLLNPALTFGYFSASRLMLQWHQSTNQQNYFYFSFLLFLLVGPSKVVGGSYSIVLAPSVSSEFFSESAHLLHPQVHLVSQFSPPSVCLSGVFLKIRYVIFRTCSDFVQDYARLSNMYIYVVLLGSSIILQYNTIGSKWLIF